MVTKKKIAILSLHPYNYGGVLSSLKVVHSFCEEYFEPTVFFVGFDPVISTSLRTCTFSSSTRRENYFGMNCYEIGARWAFWEPGHYAFTINAWKKALEGYDYFFVVSGTPIAAHPLALLNKKYGMWLASPYDDDRAERVKTLEGIYWFLNAVATPAMHSIERTILRKAGYTWALSTYAEDRFKQLAPATQGAMDVCGFPIDYSRIIYNLHSPVHKKRALIALGRFDDPRKNAAMLITVFDRLYAFHPELKLFVIGRPPAAEDMDQWRHLPSFHSISFTGYVRDDEKEHYFHLADLMLITSTQEGLSIVGLEAMAHGLPVISTDCGGPRDFIDDGENGYLVGLDDVDAMVEKSLHLLNNDGAYHAMSVKARKKIESTFSYAAVYAHFKKGLVALYPELKTTLYGDNQ